MLGSGLDGGGGIVGLEDITAHPKITARLMAAGNSDDDLAEMWSAGRYPAARTTRRLRKFPLRLRRGWSLCASSVQLSAGASTPSRWHRPLMKLCVLESAEPPVSRQSAMNFSMPEGPPVRDTVKHSDG